MSAAGGGRWARRLRLGALLAVVFALSFSFVPGEASAAALRGSALALGVLAVFAALFFVHEWPVAVTGSIWAAGTVFAAAFWLLRARVRPEWFAPAGGAGIPGLPRGAEGHVVSTPARPTPSVGDPHAVLLAARACFIRLQAAWDAADVEELRLHTTEDMLAELLEELPMRGPGPNRTDVVTLEASLLALEEIGPQYVASVEFSGMIRESPEQGATAFKEVWMLTCPKDGASVWRLARHQALL